ncbi:MAG: cupredoxin domain-containing protein [Patescibacteria group bacterium]
MDNPNLNDQATVPATPVAPATKKYKEKFLIIIIFTLLILLVVAFAYIKIQKSFNWGGGEATKNNISVEVPSTDLGTSTVGTKALLPGGSLVTPEAKVINSKFEEAKNDAIPNSPEAPKSVSINPEDLPKETLNLKISDNKITPNSFTVKTGSLISLAVTSSDNQVHVFGFYDGAMSAIAMGINGGQTKAVNFNAPTPGQYSFGCGVPGHKNNGESGTMIVK